MKPTVRRLRRAAAMIAALLGGGAGGALVALPAAAACDGANLARTMAEERPDLWRSLVAAAAARPNAEGLFWRVDPPGGGAPSWLFGTFHSAAADIATPPAAVTEALARSRLLLVEVTEAEEARMTAAFAADPARLMAPEGETLDSFLSPAQVEAARAALAGVGLSFETANRMQPWFVTLMLSMPGCAIADIRAGGVILDKALVRAAARDAVPVRGLESFEDVLAAFAGGTPEDQRRGLKMALAQAADGEDFQTTAAALYREGRTMLIWELGLRQAAETGLLPPDEVDRMAAVFWDDLVVARNARFVDHALADLEVGNVVMAVGALHLPGERGVIEMLRERGFAVTRLDG